MKNNIDLRNSLYNHVNYDVRKVNDIYSLCHYLSKSGIIFEGLIMKDEFHFHKKNEELFNKYRNYSSDLVVCNNLLLKSKDNSNSIYLLITDHNKDIDLDSLNLEYYNEENDDISLFRLINDLNNNINLIIDNDLINADELVFYPVYKDLSLFIRPSECIKYLKLISRDFNLINVISKNNKNDNKMKIKNMI